MAFLGVLCQLNAEVRMPTLVENFYKHLFEPNKEYTWKQDLNREREKKKMLPKMAVCNFFYAFRIRDHEEDSTRGWGKPGGDCIAG